MAAVEAAGHYGRRVDGQVQTAIKGGDTQGYGDWLTTRAVQAAGAPKTDERASKFPLLCKWPERRSLPP
jgi:hypothetical protein